MTDLDTTPVDTTSAQPVAAPEPATPDYGDAYDRIMAADPGEGAEPATRDEKGRFVKADGTVEADPAREQQQAEPKATVPPNMQDVADVLAGLEPEKASKLTAWADKLHRSMSDQGRALSAFKEIGGLIEQNAHVFTSRGIPVQQGLSQMLEAQARLDADPAAGLRWAAQMYRLTPEQIFGSSAAGMTGQPQPADDLRQTITELRAEIQRLSSPELIRQEIENFDAGKQVSSLVSRFSSEKPLFAEVENDLPMFIEKAWSKLGHDASYERVLDLAYDMAVFADPDLRAKASAAAKPAAPDPKAQDAVRKAASINVKSAPPKSQTYATPDEAMSAAYDRLMAS